MLSMLLKCSSMNKLRNFPATFAATFLIVVYGETHMRPAVLKSLAKVVAGPVPIERPNMNTSFAWKPRPPSDLGFKICYITTIPFAVILLGEHFCFSLKLYFLSTISKLNMPYPGYSIARTDMPNISRNFIK